MTKKKTQKVSPSVSPSVSPMGSFASSLLNRPCVPWRELTEVLQIVVLFLLEVKKHEHSSLQTGEMESEDQNICLASGAGTLMCKMLTVCVTDRGLPPA